MAYFERVDDRNFQPSDHVGGAWNVAEQHVAPALGLMAHMLETDHLARRGGDPLRLGRLSYDIMGTLPIDLIRIDVEVIRAGRTIELVEARLSHAGRTAILLRGWFVQAYATDAIAATALPSIAPPDEMAPFDITASWPGGFLKSLEARRQAIGPGRANGWLRAGLPLVAGEDVSATARVMGLVDVANGMAPLVSPLDVAFPNLDLTACFFREPAGPWLGLQSAVSIGPAGMGLTQTIIHDLEGPIGAVSQFLTVRP
ncbi:thioesterase family protein [Sphingobium chungbukense]|uniref:Thioesterase n=2 Tax=Sphingobium TaxID=165695 RepID=A0A0M3AS89_9SPHN|nr:thioesterase family protein [Sphingobium chungbukense]KKW91399.1 thioesterase [Sphingobium chungbukense]PJG49664.1 thioesterase [Sphingobium sp. LB126]